MMEARLIIPHTRNDGAPVDLEQYEAWFCDIFGGFTRTDGVGGFTGADGRIYHEPVAIYDIALANGTEEMSLRSLAEAVKHRELQEAVYVRWTSGEVEFI